MSKKRSIQDRVRDLDAIVKKVLNLGERPPIWALSRLASELNASADTPRLEAAYRKAYDEVLELRRLNPALPPPPEPVENPRLGLQRIRQWCIDAMQGGDKSPGPAPPQPKAHMESIWDDIPEEMKKAIGKYEVDAAAAKKDGKRMKVSTFCLRNGVDVSALK
jgi:hypothetical protein